MCLYTKKFKLKIAKTDIECYKIVYFNTIALQYQTPYMNTPIPNDVISGKIPFEANGNAKSQSKAVTFNFVAGEEKVNVYGKGLIHTFRYNPIYTNFILFRCIIPKGTWYIEGVDWWGKKTYGSKKIIFKERLN